MKGLYTKDPVTKEWKEIMSNPYPVYHTIDEIGTHIMTRDVATGLASEMDLIHIHNNPLLTAQEYSKLKQEYLLGCINS